MRIYVEGPLLEDLASFSNECSDDDVDSTYLETTEDDSDYADEFEGAADNDTDGNHEDSDVSSCASNIFDSDPDFDSGS